MLKKKVYNLFVNGLWVGFTKKEVQQHLKYIKQLKEYKPIKIDGVKPNNK
jgi:hypothetical protein